MTVPVCCEEIQIHDSFPKLFARNSQDKRNYMMKYEPWRFDGTRLTICHDATKPFQKDACLLTLDNQRHINRVIVTRATFYEFDR